MDVYQYKFDYLFVLISPSIYLDFETKLMRFLHSREEYWNVRQLP